VEDADYFSGAGLYDSFSGCSADDLTGNNEPSICDPTEDGPRGVFRAIRRVYASFYNDNAFLERLRLRVNESEVGMGLLVHYSSPDDIEMANGVATTKGGSPFQATFVTQLGAVSITNPDGTSTPEEVFGIAHLGQPGLNLDFRKGSSLVLLGDHVMSWPNDYEELARLLSMVRSNYRPATLDFEFKKLQPGVLEVKQMREVPSPVSAPPVPGYVLNEAITFTSVQRSIATHDLLSAHRLKSRWTFQTRNMQFTTTNLQNGFFANILVEQISGDHVVTNTLAGLSNLAYRVDGDVPVYSWRMDSGAGPANAELTVSRFLPYVSPEESLALDLADPYFNFQFSVKYDVPVWFLQREQPGDWEYVRLAPLQTNSLTEVLREAQFDQGGTGPTNVTIHSRYAIGNNHLYAGHPPFFRFEGTEIIGLTSRPLVLRGFFSQTWHGNHRQVVEWFVFEPHLEEGIEPDLLQELEAKDIRMIYLEMINDSSFPGTNRMVTFSTRAGGPWP